MHDEIWKRAWAWEQASKIPGFEPGAFRMDAHGFYIGWSDYGDRDSACGWEIDHIIPRSQGGSDDFSNLQALHWKSNVSKSDSLPPIGSLLSSLFAVDHQRIAVNSEPQSGVASLLSSMLGCDKAKDRQIDTPDLLSAMLGPEYLRNRF